MNNPCCEKCLRRAGMAQPAFECGDKDCPCHISRSEIDSDFAKPLPPCGCSSLLERMKGDKRICERHSPLPESDWRERADVVLKQAGMTMLDRGLIKTFIATELSRVETETMAKTRAHYYERVEREAVARRTEGIVVLLEGLNDCKSQAHYCPNCDSNPLSEAIAVIKSLKV